MSQPVTHIISHQLRPTDRSWFWLDRWTYSQHTMTSSSLNSQSAVICHWLEKSMNVSLCVFNEGLWHSEWCCITAACSEVQQRSACHWSPSTTRQLTARPHCYCSATRSQVSVRRCLC